MNAEESEEENLSGEPEEVDENSTGSEDEQYSLCMILAEAKRRNQDREIHTNHSSGTYSLDSDDAIGGEKLEIIAVSRKPFRYQGTKGRI